MHPLDLALVRAHVDQLQREARQAALARQVARRSPVEALRPLDRGTRTGLQLLAARAHTLTAAVRTSAASRPAAVPAGVVGRAEQVCCA